MSSPTLKHLVQRLILILQRNDRSNADKELLLSYLFGLEDLKKYLVNIPRETLIQMCAVVKAEHYSPGTVIFNKGDYSDRFYVILSGKVEIFNTSREGGITFKTYLGNGKKLGEQGLISRQPRSLSAVAADHTVMMVLNNSQFKQFLREGFLSEFSVQLTYIERYLPAIEHYSRIQRIMIAYCLQSFNYRRGETIVSEGELSEKLYIIMEGEADIIANLPTGHKSILKLSAGSLFGEEGVFLNEKTKYAVVVSSERLSLFFLRKFDAIKVLPEEITMSLTEHYRAKVKNRRLLAESKVRSEVNLQIRTEIQERPTFIWASPPARKKLEKMQLVRSMSSNNLPSHDESFQRRKSLLIQFSDNTKSLTGRGLAIRRRGVLSARNTPVSRMTTAMPSLYPHLTTRTRKSLML
mmetsp:Transcript_34400/g.60283  ORF Transcript_34400/g.60283 Transcript_34400/m.60283 type:complete len:409 (+) Transcript_34400:3207-4433(+)